MFVVLFPKGKSVYRTKLVLLSWSSRFPPLTLKVAFFPNEEFLLALLINSKYPFVPAVVKLTVVKIFINDFKYARSVRIPETICTAKGNGNLFMSLSLLLTSQFTACLYVLVSKFAILSSLRVGNKMLKKNHRPSRDPYSKWVFWLHMKEQRGKFQFIILKA